MIAPKSWHKRRELSIVCGLFVISLFIRLAIVLPTHFDGLYGQDAYAYYDYAQYFTHSIQTGTDLKPFFWPLGYPALLAASLGIGGTHPPVAQAISILLGAGLTPMVYGLSRQLGTGRVSSLIAAALMTLCGQALQSSIVIMSDIPALFWVTLSALLLNFYLNRFTPKKTSPQNYLLILAAVTLVIAGITRWLYFALGIPFTLAVLIVWRGRIRWRVTGVAILTAGLILLPQIIYSRTNPAPTLNHEWVAGWSPANAFQRTFTNIDGHFEYEKINAVFYAQPYYDPYYLSPLFTIFMVLGLWALTKRHLWNGIVIGGWALLPYLFLAGIPYQNIRFPLIVFPAVAVLVGSGLQVVAQWLSQFRIKKYNLTYARWLLAAIVVLGLWQTWGRANQVISTFISNQQRDKLAASWAGENIPSGATVFTFGLTLTLKHYTTLDVYEIYYETPDTLAQKWQHGQSDYLVLNVWNIENQWAGRDPQLDYHWLRDNRGLEQLGKFGNYTLFKIRG